MSEKRKPVGMCYDITTGKNYKVYAAQSETITFTLTREQAEALYNGVVTEEIQNKVKEKLK
jgi:hypothetical protein